MSNTEMKKGGPYTKPEQEKRKEQVYKMHFEYGHSAREIAKTLGVNRNTVNDDIKELYEDVGKKWRVLDFHNLFEKHVERLEIQRTSIKMELDRTGQFSERLALQKLILDLDSKIFNSKAKIIHHYEG